MLRLDVSKVHSSFSSQTGLMQYMFHFDHKFVHGSDINICVNNSFMPYFKPLLCCGIHESFMS